ncbi:MAG: NAD(P)H-quinone oxidoreductase [Burkholderiales bacterium]
MRYIDHGQGGPASVMKVAEGPKPEPKAAEVLIEVQYAGVNRPDVLQRAGAYPPPPGASPVLGLEVAGKVVAAGAGVAWPAVGDLVCALAPGGGYSEYCTVPAGQCLPIPNGLSVMEAASLPETFFTVWTNVFDRGRLKAGERFLVHGGSSGIGSTAIQLAKAFGANVLTTVGNEAKAKFCESLGADVAINYRVRDWAAEVWKATGKQGVNVILDMVGGDYTMKNIRSLAVEGRLVQIAFLKESKIADFDAMPIMIRRLTFTGSTLRPRSVEDKTAIANALREKVWPLLELKKVKTVIHKVFPLGEVQAAHELMESSAHVGKIVLEVKKG